MAFDEAAQTTPTSPRLPQQWFFIANHYRQKEVSEQSSFPRNQPKYKKLSKEQIQAFPTGLALGIVIARRRPTAAIRNFLILLLDFYSCYAIITNAMNCCESRQRQVAKRRWNRLFSR